MINKDEYSWLILLYARVNENLPNRHETLSIELFTPRQQYFPKANDRLMTLYVFPCVILFLCFSVLLVLRLPRLEKRELILVLFVRLFGLCLFRFVGFLFLLGSGKGCGLWLWHSLVPVLVLLFVALWFILRGDLLYVFPCVILFLCFSLLYNKLPRRDVNHKATVVC